MERRYYIQNPVPIACPSPRGGFSYKIVGLKKLKGNRCISISNCGFKIYSLKNNSQYSYDLLNELYYNIKEIYEINNNEIIIISHRYIDENNKNYNRTNTNTNFQPFIGIILLDCLWVCLHKYRITNPWIIPCIILQDLHHSPNIKNLLVNILIIMICS